MAYKFFFGYNIPYMKRTITACLAKAAEEYPERTYVARKTDNGWKTYGFGEVYRLACGMAAWLRANGVQRGDRVAILAEGSPQWVITELGVLLAGGIAVPLSIKLLPEEISFRVNHSEAKMVALSHLTLEKGTSILSKIEHPVRILYLDEEGEQFFQQLEGVGVPREQGFLWEDCISSGTSLLADTRESPYEEEIREEDIVTISYTSGTTGNPKGILLTHLNYYTNSQDSVEIFQVPPLQYQTLLILPCDHSFAHTVGLYCGILRGISVYFVDSRGGGMGMVRNIPANLLETNPVFLLTVPSLSGNFMKKIQQGIQEKGPLVKALFDLGIRAGIQYYGDGFNRPSFRVRAKYCWIHRLIDLLIFRKVRKIFGNQFQFFVGGGALLDIRQQEFFNALGIPVYQGYGLTEAAPVISSNTPFAHKFGTSGKVCPSVTCKIIREDGKPAGIDEIGQICIQGANVMKGYYRNETATQETLRDGWLYTGDLGYVDEDGFLVVVGREKALLISYDGEKYSPEEIEEAILTTSPFISQVMLYNEHRKYTSALIVLDDEAVQRFITRENIPSAEVLLEQIGSSILNLRKDPYYGKRFPSCWLPVTFAILPEPFTEQNGMINSTLKMVRHRVLEAYKDTIEYLYTEEGHLPRNSRNLAALSRYFTSMENREKE